MKINFMSDLHLEFGDLHLPGGDVLILAGDIMVAGVLRRADNAGKDKEIADCFRRFANEELVKYDHVLMIAGNHEHYHNDFNDTIPRIKQILPPHVVFLDKETVKIEDTLFFGATFWTDMNKADPNTIFAIKSMMNDFRVIGWDYHVPVTNPYGSSYNKSKFTPHAAIQEHQKTLEFLKVALTMHNKIVVISHHAPSFASIHPGYVRDTLMNGAYASDLTNLILDNPQIKAWVHGHVHWRQDYMVGSTRILANPRGYHDCEDIASTFDPTTHFEV